MVLAVAFNATYVKTRFYLTYYERNYVLIKPYAARK